MYIYICMCGGCSYRKRKASSHSKYLHRLYSPYMSVYVCVCVKYCVYEISFIFTIYVCICVCVCIYVCVCVKYCVYEISFIFTIYVCICVCV